MRGRVVWFVLVLCLVLAAIVVTFLLTRRNRPHFIAAAKETPEMCVQQGHGEAVLCVAWSPD